jgi:Potential Queuosine, Q, salvage protein family
VGVLVEAFPAFADKAEFHGSEVFILKKAQLLAADLHRRFKVTIHSSFSYFSPLSPLPSPFLGIRFKVKVTFPFLSSPSVLLAQKDLLLLMWSSFFLLLSLLFSSSPIQSIYFLVGFVAK